MLTSVAPNGTPTPPAPAREYICVPIDDEWEPMVGDELRHRENGSVRKVKGVFGWPIISGPRYFTFELGGARFNFYADLKGSYSVKLTEFMCFRPVEITRSGATITPPAPQKPVNPSAEDMHRAIDAECGAIAVMLQGKNRAYGNSIADPIKVFSKADADERINVRLDDKISRLVHGKPDDNEDTELDLIGYLILRRAKRRAQGKV